jgi:oligopeptide/dipeptide ABC transporter ATP-binding protein
LSVPLVPTVAMPAIQPNIDGAAEALLRVEDLCVAFRKPRGEVLPVIDKVNLALRRNRTVGVVGESGSGKTMLCRTLIGTLSRHGAFVTSGRILLEGQDLARANEVAWRKVRGRVVGYVPQSSLASLNPVLTVETQLIEAIRAVRPASVHEARTEALHLLELVRISRARQVLAQRSHELSGGMRQRVVIAAALAQRPRVLIADEPTTALDVTVEHQILGLIADIQQEFAMSMMLVSHDLAVIDDVCDDIVVMYAGASVETGSREQIAARQRHPYTRALHLSRVDSAPPGQYLEAIGGETPPLGAWPIGCRFWPRCPLADSECRQGEQPPLAWIDGRWTACIHADRMGPA